MRTIWRFALPVTDRPELQMPIGARVLGVGPFRQSAGDGMYHVNPPLDMWAEVESDAPTELREFLIVGTGNPLPAVGHYVGTATGQEGLIWHVYEVGRGPSSPEGTAE